MTAVAVGAAAAARQAGLPNRFRALVVVADPFARATLVRDLAGLGAVDILEAASLAEARVRAVGPARELAVVDLTLPDGSGLTLLHELRAAGWGRALVLSALEDPYTVRGALAAGVRSFVVWGGTNSHSATVPTQRGARGAGGGPEGLSGREIEVLQLVADGKSNKDIGVALGLSALTVKSHLARIARKLGTGDRAEMVVVSLRAGVIS